MSQLKLAVIVGSFREGSLNRKLAQALVGLMGDRVQADVLQINDLPFYDYALEPGRNDAINRFTDAVAASDAALVVTPELNRSIPAVLKNAIDWGSKPADKNVWRDLPVLIAGTSPGAIGSAVAQQHLRQVLAVVGAEVKGGEAYIQFKDGLVDDNGKITVDSTRDFLQAYVDGFLTFANKLKA